MSGIVVSLFAFSESYEYDTIHRFVFVTDDSMNVVEKIKDLGVICLGYRGR